MAEAPQLAAIAMGCERTLLACKIMMIILIIVIIITKYHISLCFLYIMWWCSISITINTTRIYLDIVIGLTN